MYNHIDVKHVKCSETSFAQHTVTEVWPALAPCSILYSSNYGFGNDTLGKLVHIPAACGMAHCVKEPVTSQGKDARHVPAHDQSACQGLDHGSGKPPCQSMGQEQQHQQAHDRITPGALGTWVDVLVSLLVLHASPLALIAFNNSKTA